MTRRGLAAFIAASAALAGCVPALQGPAWRPDSKAVLFIQRSDSPAGALFAVDLGGEEGRPRRLPAGSDARVGAACWSAKGDAIYYSVAAEKGWAVRRCLPDGEDDSPVASFPDEEVRWLAPRSDGGELFALACGEKSIGGSLVAIDLGELRVGAVEGAPRGLRGPAMSADGSAFYFLAPAGDGASAQLCRLAVSGGKPEELAALASAEGETGAVAASADGRTVVACAKGLTVVSLRGGQGAGPGAKPTARSFELPEGAVPYLLTISPDGSEVFVGAVVGADSDETASLRLDVARGRFETVEKDRVLLGGRTWSPSGDLYAEHTAAGLRVAHAKGGWDRDYLYPVTMRQSLLAARAGLKAGRADEASAYLAGGLASGIEDAPRSALLYEKCRVHLDLHEEREATASFLDAYLQYPEAAEPPAADIVELMKRIEPLGDRILPPLLSAEESSLRREFDKADAQYKEALALIAEEGCVGGILYRRARVAEERSQIRQAAQFYSRAADCEGFPQAEFAALRAACCYAVSERPELARERILKTLDRHPGSPRADALRAAAEALKDLAAPLRRVVEEAAPDGAPRAWIERAASFSVETWPGGSAKPEERASLRVQWLHGVSVESDGGRRRMILEGIPVPLGGLAVSPDGSLVAFGARAAAGSEVAAAGAAWAGVFAADRSGRVLIGDAKALRAGELPRDSAAESFRWSGDGKAVIAVRPPASGGGPGREARLEVPPR